MNRWEEEPQIIFLNFSILICLICRSNVDGFASIHDVKIKSANRRGKNQGDHHVAINKTLKEEMKLKSPKNRKSTKFHSFREDNCSIAAEMKPADQSCITLSKIFMHLSKASKTMINVRESLSNEISPITILDSTFLGGSANEVSCNKYSRITSVL